MNGHRSGKAQVSGIAGHTRKRRRFRWWGIVVVPAVAASTLLGLLMGVLLVRSFWLSDRFFLSRDDERLQSGASTGLGGLHLWFAHGWHAREYPYPMRDITSLSTWFPPEYPYERPPWPSRIEKGKGDLFKGLGFQISHRLSIVPSEFWHERFIVVVPLVVPLFLFAIPPWICWRRRRETRRRIRQGLCLECGYNLYGGLTICPECGTPHAATPGAATGNPTGA